MKINIFLKLVGFSILLFLIHSLIATYLVPNYFVKGLYKIHLFMGVATMIIVFLIQKVTKVDAENFSKGYLVSVVLKMMCTIGFLWPVISNPTENQKLYIAHFFIIFFIYLITEVKLLISTIQKK